MDVSFARLPKTVHVPAHSHPGLGRRGLAEATGVGVWQGAQLEDRAGVPPGCRRLSGCTIFRVAKTGLRGGSNSHPLQFRLLGSSWFGDHVGPSPPFARTVEPVSWTLFSENPRGLGGTVLTSVLPILL